MKDEVITLDDDDEAVTVELSEEELKLRRKSHRSRVVTGQVPQIVANDDIDDDEVEILEENPYNSNQADAFKANYPIHEVPYVNVPRSKFGKIVMDKVKAAADDNDNAKNRNKKKIVGEKYTISACQKPNGLVQFAHPKIPGHKVMSASMEDAADWLKAFESEEEEHEVKVTAKKKKKKLTLKPLEELMAAAPKKEERIIINSDGKKGVNIFLSNKSSHKEQKEMPKLYYELGKETFEDYFNKSISHVQILTKAKAEAKKLKDYEKVSDAPPDLTDYSLNN